MKIRVLLPTLVGLLALALLVETAVRAVDAWHARDKAYRFALSDQLRGRLIQAAGFWAGERGQAYLWLQSQQEPSAATLLEIRRNRERGDQLLDEAMTLLARNGHFFPIDASWPSLIEAVHQRVLTLRGDVDAVLMNGHGGPDRRTLAATWYKAATDQIELAQEMRHQVLFATPVADEHVVVQSEVKHFAWVTSEFAGRERAIVGALLAANEPLNNRLEALAEIHGKFTLAWEMVRALANIDTKLDLRSATADLATRTNLGASDSHADAVSADFLEAAASAQTAYDRFSAIVRPKVFRTAHTGEPYDISAIEWWNEASAFVDAIRRIQDASIAHTAIYTAQLSDKASRDFALAVGLLMLGLFATVLSLVIIWRRILTPVRRLTQAMGRLAEDDLTVPVPHPGRADEIGAMADAVVVFKKMAIARRRLSAFQNAMLASANNSIVATDTNGVIQVFSPSAERMLGYTADEMEGRHMPCLFHLPEEVAHRSRELSKEFARPIETGFEALVARARSGIPDQAEWTYVRKDGTRFPVLLSVAAIRDDDGAPLGFLGIGTDITELKQVERLKNEFISTVSHELRTPLTAIRASLGMVTSGAFGQLPEEAHHLADIALQSSERLVRLINDILDVEKIASGALKLELAPVFVQEAVDQALQDNQASAERLGIGLRVTSSLPDTQVTADLDRLIQVFTNLLSNAIKFSPPGGDVTVTVTCPRDGWIRVAIGDHGPGIPETFRDKVFQRFAQADSSDIRSKGGTGLGLNITKSIVERFNGRIWYDTDVGVGSTFFVELPVWPTPKGIESLPEETGIPIGGHRPAILVCEDDPDVGKLLSMLLEQANFATALATTAAEARHLIHERAFAAMTLDLRLPDQSGIELIGELRANLTTRDFPIIVVSAIADQERRRLNGDAVAIIDWLNKPIDEERLIAAVNNAVRNGQSRRRVLHIEDDPEILAVVSALLSGFVDVIPARSLAEARQAAALERFDLALIDLGLPDGYGLDVIPDLKDGAGRTIPVVVFTALENSTIDLDRVTATLIKSRVSNDVLVETIRTLIPNNRTAA